MNATDFTLFTSLKSNKRGMKINNVGFIQVDGEEETNKAAMKNLKTLNCRYLANPCTSSKLKISS